MKNIILAFLLSAMSLSSIAKENDFRGHDVTMNMAVLSMSSLDFNYVGLSMLPMSVQYVYQHTGHLGYGKTKTVKSTIVSCDGKKLMLKDENGKTHTYEKYQEVK